MTINIPKDHPRYESLLNREKIIEGCEDKVVAAAGLIAHGRGEAFDYLFGEVSCGFAAEAITAAACVLLLAKYPVISVNGNVAALCPQQLVILSQVTAAPLEVNLFYRSSEREQAIFALLVKQGAANVLGIGERASARIPELGSERRRVDPDGILKADVVLVPLEDGDRTEALVAMGKTVITVDLNPLSRTAQKAQITIVDNIIRVMPLLIKKVKELKLKKVQELRDIWDDYNNQAVLGRSLNYLAQRLEELAKG